jgi:predicted DNA-binding antitoxin AbrB/MazE fold protein
MSLVITATFEDGVLKPDGRLDLPPMSRVRLLIETITSAPEGNQQAWDELERLWEDASVDSGGVHLTRDQLHERR